MPGKVYGFLVEAFEEGATDHRWAARCTASSIDGVTTLAACQALSEYGTIRVDLAQILADSLLTCDPTVLEEASSIDVTFDEGTTPVTATGLACDHDPVVGPFSRGSHGGEVTLRGQGGSLRGHAICFASVEPAVQALRHLRCRLIARRETAETGSGETRRQEGRGDGLPSTRRRPPCTHSRASSPSRAGT